MRTETAVHHAGMAFRLMEAAGQMLNAIRGGEMNGGPLTGYRSLSLLVVPG